MTTPIELEFNEHGEENIYLKDEKGTRYFFKDKVGFLNHRTDKQTRVIAAAPEMLAAIELVLNECVLNYIQAWDSPGMTALKAAARKAKGEDDGLDR